MGIVTIGLLEVLFGPLAADGGPGTALTRIGYTSLDSLEIAEDDPSEKLVQAEETDWPLARFIAQGASRVNFNIADPDVDALARTRGGTLSTASGKTTYAESGDTFVALEGTLQIKPKQGFESITYNRVSIYGKFANLGKNQELVLQVQTLVMKPTKTGVNVFEVVQNAPGEETEE